MPQERIADADLIVIGTVSMVTMAAPSPWAPITRHDPAWNRAMIEIERVEKGTPPGKRVEALFPSSTDVMWYRVPKFHQGQQGDLCKTLLLLVGGSLPGMCRKLVTRRIR
jgi:hypothetical protein